MGYQLPFAHAPPHLPKGADVFAAINSDAVMNLRTSESGATASDAVPLVFAFDADTAAEMAAEKLRLDEAAARLVEFKRQNAC